MTTRRVRSAVLALALVAALFTTAPGASARPDPVTCDQYWELSSSGYRIYEADGTLLHQLEDIEDFQGWSDDGRAMTWIRRDGPQPNEDGVPDGYVANVVIADGRGDVMVEVPRSEFGGDVDFVRWGSFGSQLHVSGADGTYVMTRDGVVVGGPYFGEARLSPDGRHIAYVDGTKTLRIVRLADGATVDVVGPLDAAVGAILAGLSWSADSSQLLYWQGDAFDFGEDAMFVTDLAGTVTRLNDARRLIFSGGATASWVGSSGDIALRDYVVTDAAAGRTAGSLLVGPPGGPYTSYETDPGGLVEYGGSTPDGAYIVLYVTSGGDFAAITVDRRTGAEVLTLVDTSVGSIAADGDLIADLGSAVVRYDRNGSVVETLPDHRTLRPCPAFGDLAFTSFALRDVAVIAELGITTGTSDLTYSPFDAVTRGQMAAFLARMWEALGNTCGGTLGEFVDVPASSFAYAPVACIKDLGVTNGTGNGTYSPAAFVTREQMAAFLARMWEALGNTCGGTPGEFTDVPVTSFAYEAVACIKDLGITNGVSPTTYGPAQLVTREQMAAFIGRFWRAA
ncbi:MAG: S-layer homology domain-containing protein [Actinomycetota bacterium]